MNSTITQEFIDEEIERDPDAARSEWFDHYNFIPARTIRGQGFKNSSGTRG
jgi:hypothetical protein